METSWVVSYVFAGVLIACAVIMMIALIRGAINRQRTHDEVRLRMNDRRVQMADMEFREMMQSRVENEPMALCIASVNPDGSVAVARELVIENKSAV